jgi:hypothetical protein
MQMMQGGSNNDMKKMMSMKLQKTMMSASVEEVVDTSSFGYGGAEIKPSYAERTHFEAHGGK